MKTLVLLLCCLSIGLGSELVGGSPASGAPTQWSSTKSPKDNGEISLVGVSCVQSDWCMAAGRVHGGRTLFDSWSGSAWTLVPSPKPPGHPTYLQGVSCTSSQFCVAAGYDFGRNGTRAAIETWNGIVWSVTHSPKVASAYLYAVSCAGPTFCVAVGRSVVGSSQQDASLIESWNGSTWSVDPSPNEADGDNLEGVSCTSSTNCVAAGWAGTDSGGSQSFIVSWDGTSWSITTSANDGAATELDAVSCTSSVSCMAVGTAFEPAEPSLDTVTVAEYWNGSEWTITPTSDPGVFRNFLTGVSCTSDRDCVAVGYDWYLQSSPFQSVIESWNGDAWSLTPSPNKSSSSDLLTAVSCADQNDCVAVGWYDKSSAHPLVETGTAS